MEQEKWKELRVAEAKAAEERVAALKSRIEAEQVQAALQYNLDQFKVSVDSTTNEISAESVKLDSTGKPFYSFTMHSDNSISEKISEELPFTPIIISAEGKAQTPAEKVEMAWMVYTVFLLLGLLALFSLFVVYRMRKLELEAKKKKEENFYDFVGQQMSQELAAPRRAL